MTTRVGSPPIVRIALAAGVGYYLGSLAGLALRLPAATPSLLWPPNAILTGVLLATPPRQWKWVLLAALPAHLAAQLPTEWPLALILGFYVTNCSEALLGAAGLRLLSDSPTRLDTPARLAAFVAAVVLMAPLASTFADAGVAAFFHDSPYWVVFGNRLPANVLTQLVVTPFVMTVLKPGQPWPPWWSRGRVIEAGALGVTLVGAGVFSLGRGHNPTELGLAIMAAPLAVYLPLTVWAAVRFGPAGASLAMFAMTAVAAGEVVHDGGPYRGVPPEQVTLAVQIVLAILALTLLAIAALVEERRQTIHALDQQNDALTASEEMKSAILNSLTRGVAVLDRDGIVLDVNAAWKELWTTAARASSEIQAWAVRAGDNLTTASDAAADTLVAEVGTQVRALLAGARTNFAIERMADLAEGPRWWQLAGVRLNRPDGGAVLTLTEITEQRRAEIEAQQRREQLTHVGRVSTMGELAASLAHQLNQPLAAIMFNAQAARRLLDRRPLEADEVCRALSDVVSDARRASNVIGDVRTLLRKRTVDMGPVDVAALTRDVAALVAGDARARRAIVVLDVEAQPVLVHGDRVELQQVVLNLVVNALEAVAGRPGNRRVRVGCHRTPSDEACVTVGDSGPGLEGGERVFEPFYTTKPHGMGMGLPIARTIVEKHGGAIRADRAAGETVFEFRLPLLESAVARARPGA